MLFRSSHRHKHLVVMISSSTTGERITICFGMRQPTDQLLLAVSYRPLGLSTDPEADGYLGRVSDADPVYKPILLTFPEANMCFPSTEGVQWAAFRMEDTAGSCRTMRLSFVQAGADRGVLKLTVELSELVPVVAGLPSQKKESEAVPPQRWTTRTMDMLDPDSNIV